MPKDAGRRVQKMDPLDREALLDQVEAGKSQLQAIDSRETDTASTLDRGALERQIRRKENILDRDEGLIAKGAQKDRLAKRAEELEKEIRENMPSRDEMWARPGTVESERAVRKNMKFEAEHGDKVREWKEIQNRLEPEDPLVSNVERLRSGQ
jgi:hypothetical protein